MMNEEEFYHDGICNVCGKPALVDFSGMCEDCSDDGTNLWCPEDYEDYQEEEE